MTVLALLPLILVPGYLTLAAWPRARRLDFWEGAFLACFAGILLTSWPAMVLAEAGVFSLPLLAAVLGAYSAAVIIVAHRRMNVRWLGRPRSGWTAWIFLAIMALAAWAFSRPAEVVAGTFDPGVYLATGASISRYGAIAYQDPFVSQLDADLRPYLLEPRQETGVGEIRLPAFWMPEAGGDTVIPAFFHLYPVWLAVFYSAGGLPAALFVSPVFALMGVWALFLLGRRLGGPGAGLLAATLLAVNPAQVWFARYPISETTVQMLLLGGLTLVVYMHHQRSSFLAVMAGSALGLAHLAKVDQAFIPAALAITAGANWLLRRPLPHDTPVTRLYLFLLVPYAFLAGHALVHVYLFSFAYTWINLSPFLPTLRSTPALLAIVIAYVAAVAAVAFRDRLRVLWPTIAIQGPRISVALAAIVTGAALYGYFLWPQSLDARPSVFLSSDGITPVYMNLFREEGLVRLGWYLGPLGMALGLAGFVGLAGRLARKGALPLLTVFSGQTVLYLLTAGLAYPVHFWAMRRYVSVVIPAFVLFASLAILWLHRHLQSSAQPAVGPDLPSDPFHAPSGVTRHRAHMALALIPAALAAMLIWPSLQSSNNILWHTEYAGALASLERWAGEIEDPAVVLFEPRMEGNIFATPLQSFFGKTSFVLQKEMDEPFYSRGVRDWISKGNKVYVVLAGQPPAHISGDLSYRLIDGQGIEFENMEQAVDHLPRQSVRMPFPLRLYRLEPAALSGSGSGAIVLEWVGVAEASGD